MWDFFEKQKEHANQEPTLPPAVWNHLPHSPSCVKQAPVWCDWLATCSPNNVGPRQGLDRARQSTLHSNYFAPPATCSTAENEWEMPAASSFYHIGQNHVFPRFQKEQGENMEKSGQQGTASKAVWKHGGGGDNGNKGEWNWKTPEWHLTSILYHETDIKRVRW